MSEATLQKLSRELYQEAIPGIIEQFEVKINSLLLASKNLLEHVSAELSKMAKS